MGSKKLELLCQIQCNFYTLRCTGEQIAKNSNKLISYIEVRWKKKKHQNYGKSYYNTQALKLCLNGPH